MAEEQLNGKKVTLENFPEIPQAFLPQPEKEVDLKERHVATPMKRPRRQDSPIASPSSIRKKAGSASLKQALLKKRLQDSATSKDKGKEKKNEEEKENEDVMRQEIRKELAARPTKGIAPEVVNKVTQANGLQPSLPINLNSCIRCGRRKNRSCWTRNLEQRRCARDKTY